MFRFLYVVVYFLRALYHLRIPSVRHVCACAGETRKAAAKADGDEKARLMAEAEAITAQMAELTAARDKAAAEHEQQAAKLQTVRHTRH